ncbi:ankyrin repeat domain-containing protein 50-like [Colias croceus]|uniref:ankyrin repeat domain-containing protein 50-like n=1 Tax=Colias crocea TaxID=72248 RepID=UPI001E27D59F|nr:ankyrin repeat domain-containing protein 50-like [Colias croceus]
MSKSLEDNLINKIISEDQDAILSYISKGANPNKITSQGKTCLGEASSLGNITIVKLLLETCKSEGTSQISSYGVAKKKHCVKSHKRKYKGTGQHDDSVSKCKNRSHRVNVDFQNEKDTLKSNSSTRTDKNQGYFVFINSDGSSSDESRFSNVISPKSPSLATTPLAELEWDEDIGSVAPTTSEDETWSSMYKWYAAILEKSGAAIAAATMVSNGINQQDAFMRTALHYAAEQGHTDIVKLLLDAGSKLDITAGDGLTSLHIAVIKNHIETVKELLSAGSHVNYKTHEKMTALHFAASRGYLDLVKILVSNGAYLEARDTNERTALYLAAGRGHVDVIKYLISAGANINGEEIHGYTPLCESVWQRYTKVVELLLKSGARITHSHKLLHNAILQGQEDIVTMLVSHGGGINLHNDTGDTPLLLAVRLSQISVVKILLQKGANANICNSITGANALHVAVESVKCPNEFEELIIWLLDYKIDMNTTALTGDTALNRALLLQRDNAAMILIQHGADVNACDSQSCGLDNLAIVNRRVPNSIASLLLKAGHFIPVSECRVENSTLQTKDTTEHWLHSICREPLSLLDLCRIRIRLLCKKKPLHRYINLLPLPKSLKTFLMFRDECNIFSCT